MAPTIRSHTSNTIHTRLPCVRARLCDDALNSMASHVTLVPVWSSSAVCCASLRAVRPATERAQKEARREAGDGPARPAARGEPPHATSRCVADAFLHQHDGADEGLDEQCGGVETSTETKSSGQGAANASRSVGRERSQPRRHHRVELSASIESRTRNEAAKRGASRR